MDNPSYDVTTIVAGIGTAFVAIRALIKELRALKDRSADLHDRKIETTDKSTELLTKLDALYHTELAKRLDVEAQLAECDQRNATLTVRLAEIAAIEIIENQTTEGNNNE